MKTWIIFKNNLSRVAARKYFAVISVGFTFALIFAAVFFSARLETKGHLAVVGDLSVPQAAAELLQISYLEEIPPKSDLVMNRYHAVVVASADGWEIMTIRDDQFRGMIESILAGGRLPAGMEMESRPIGVTILGFLSMFILMQGFLFMGLLTEDKQSGTLKRTLTSPVSLKSFLAGHIAVNFGFIYIITMIVITICRLAGMDLGFSLYQYGGMIALITLLATAFALFVMATAEKEDNALSAAGIIVVASSILSGSFYAISGDNGVLQATGSLFPQKSFLDIAEGLYLGASLREYWPQFAHILILAAVFILAAGYITKHRSNKGCYL